MGTWLTIASQKRRRGARLADALYRDIKPTDARHTFHLDARGNPRASDPVFSAPLARLYPMRSLQVCCVKVGRLERFIPWQGIGSADATCRSSTPSRSIYS
jgi:hypothetical protein